MAELKDGHTGSVWSYRDMMNKIHDKIPSRGDFGGGWEVHHFVEEDFAKFLELHKIPDFDLKASPSIPLRARADAIYDSTFKNQFPNIDVPYHQEKGIGIKQQIDALKRRVGKNPQALVTGLFEIYNNPPFKQLNLWPATREYLVKWVPKKHPDVSIP